MTTGHRSRSIRAAAATVAVVAATLLAPAAPAHADLLDVTCLPPSSQIATFDPPLTQTPRDVTVTRNSQYGLCVSTTVPGLTSGVTFVSFTAKDRSCATLLSPTTTVFTITWNTGQTSTLSTNNTATHVGGLLLVTRTGTVTDGLFQGDSVVSTSQAPATDLTLCLLGLGTVSSIYSIGDLVITSLGGN